MVYLEDCLKKKAYQTKAMTQLLEEHDRLAGGMLTWQDYKIMDFTQCVIDETLRLGGIAIWLMREAKEDVSYQDELEDNEDNEDNVVEPVDDDHAVADDNEDHTPNVAEPKRKRKRGPMKMKNIAKDPVYARCTWILYCLARR